MSDRSTIAVQTYARAFGTAPEAPAFSFLLSPARFGVHIHGSGQLRRICVGGRSWQLAPSSGSIPKKGFGFILNPEGMDVFVHFSSIQGDGFRALKDGEKVEYDQVAGAKGLMPRR